MVQGPTSLTSCPQLGEVLWEGELGNGLQLLLRWRWHFHACIPQGRANRKGTASHSKAKRMCILMASIRGACHPCGSRDRYGTRRVAGGALVQVRDSPELSKAHAACYILIQSRVQDRAVNGEIKQCGKEQEPPSNVVLLSPPQRVTPAVLLSGAAWRGKWS